MRTESTTPSASAATRLRGEMARARRWVSGWGRLTRLASIAAGATVLVALACWWAIPIEREELLWLYDGRKFSPESALAIEKALAVEKIAFKADGSNRIGVAPAKWPDALVALEKHGVEPPSLEGIDRELSDSDLWTSPEDRSQKRQRQLERTLKAIIESYQGIRSANVMIMRTPVKGGLRATSNVSGAVVIDAVPRPTHRVINSIKTLLSTSVADLREDAVTISDRTGHFYLRAGDRTTALVTQSHAREEELREGLLDSLRETIPGVEVVVQVEPPNMAEPMPPATQVIRPAKNVPPPPAPSAEEIKTNAAMSLEPEPEPESPPEPEPRATQVAPASLPSVGKANVWVKVPRSYYLRIARTNAPNRPPSQEELIAYSQKTRELVENAVTVLVPPAERGRVLVNMVLDDLGASGPLIVPSGSADPRRTWPAWVPPVALGAGAGLGVALVFVTGFGMMTGRRPEARPSRASVRSGLSVDPPSGLVPGPSERVRDLVRRDPEAAAGVLQRWIGQGDGGTNG